MLRIIFVFAVTVIIVSFGVFFKNHQESVVPEREPKKPVLSKVKTKGVSARWIHYVRTVLPGVLNDYKDDIKEASILHDVDPKMVASILVVESMGNPHALSTTGARGCMQTLRSTDGDIDMYEQDSFDCPTSILKGAKYLSSLRDRYGITDPFRAIVAYSVGPNGVKRYTDKQVRNNDYFYKVRAVMKEIPNNTFL